MKKNKDAKAWATGEIDVTLAKALLRRTEEMAKKYGPKVDWLHDLRDVKTPKFRARKILAEAATNQSIRKCAFFGASFFIRTVACLISTTSGQKSTRHFTTEEEALKKLGTALKRLEMGK